MKVCIFVVGFITVLFAIFGVFVPWTLSADSTSLNILGGLVILFSILFVCWFLPAQVVDAINNKISATQKAQMRENEVREAEAAAKKAIAAADGEAKSILLRAQAQAEANKVISA